MTNNNVSGQAAAIRDATESETFDLGGQNVSTIENTIKAAFEKPFPPSLDKMIRITFVTGAGKQARSKYDDGAAKAVTSTLRSLGYEEDRAAGCVIESAGSFKSQHDTGKNLKTVVVFPKLSFNAADGDHGSESVSGGGNSIVDENSHDYKVAVCNMNVFANMVKYRCVSWFEKKGCSEVIDELQKKLEVLNGKLMTGTVLDDAEQHFYNDVCVSLDEKQSYLKKEMQTQIESGQITKQEHEYLLKQNADRIANAKKVGPAVLKRKALLESITATIPQYKLKHEAEIMKLLKELVPLLALEQKTQGRLLSIKETAQMTRKDEILDEIEELESASQGWFEDDSIFAWRLLESRRNRKQFVDERLDKKKPASKGTSSSLGGTRRVTGSATSKWVTPKQMKGAGRATAKKKKGGGGSGLFAAMMDDSDSDSDEDEFVVVKDNSGFANNPSSFASVASNSKLPLKKKAVIKKIEKISYEPPKVVEEESPTEPPSKEQKNSSGGGNKNKKKKKKKANKGKKTAEEVSNEELDPIVVTEVVNNSKDVQVTQDANKTKTSESETSAVNVAIATVVSKTAQVIWYLLKSILFPLVVAFLNWFIEFVFGNKKNKKNKKSNSKSKNN